MGLPGRVTLTFLSIGKLHFKCCWHSSFAPQQLLVLHYWFTVIIIIVIISISAILIIITIKINIIIIIANIAIIIIIIIIILPWLSFHCYHHCYRCCQWIILHSSSMKVPKNMHHICQASLMRSFLGTSSGSLSIKFKTSPRKSWFFPGFEQSVEKWCDMSVSTCEKLGTPICILIKCLM